MRSCSLLLQLLGLTPFIHWDRLGSFRINSFYSQRDEVGFDSVKQRLHAHSLALTQTFVMQVRH